MTGIWSLSDSRWRPAEPVSFRLSKELHDLIEQAPELLPLAGSPHLVMRGEKCLAAKAMPISLRLRWRLGGLWSSRSSWRRTPIGARYSRRSWATPPTWGTSQEKGFDALLHHHLAKQSLASVAAAAQASSQDPGFDPDGFPDTPQARPRRASPAVCRRDRRCDAGPHRIGRLPPGRDERQAESRFGRRTEYDIGDRRVLVPQLIEPDRSQMSAASGTMSAPPATETVKGVEEFKASINKAPPNHRPGLRQLLAWALDLEVEGLAVLYHVDREGPTGPQTMAARTEQRFGCHLQRQGCEDFAVSNRVRTASPGDPGPAG